MKIGRPSRPVGDLFLIPWLTARCRKDLARGRSNDNCNKSPPSDGTIPYTVTITTSCLFRCLSRRFLVVIKVYVLVGLGVVELYPERKYDSEQNSHMCFVPLFPSWIFALTPRMITQSIYLLSCVGFYQSWSPCCSRSLSLYNDNINGIDLPPCNN